MIAALTTEGSIVNLEEYGDFHIETHSVIEGQFQVKAYPSRTAASVNSINLAQGSKEECKAYVRETLAPLLGLDTRTPTFIEHYGQTCKSVPAKLNLQGSKSLEGSRSKLPSLKPQLQDKRSNGVTHHDGYISTQQRHRKADTAAPQEKQEAKEAS